MKAVVGCLALWLSLSACSAAGSQMNTRRSVEPAAPAGSVVLYVTNENNEDVRLYLLRGSTQIPIGSVGSFSSRRFVIPSAQVGSSGALRLIAQALGSRATAAPEALDIEPGSEVEFHIESNLIYSRLMPRVLRSR